MLEIARNAISLANRPCFMWVKDTGRDAQQGGSLLILILYVVLIGDGTLKISAIWNFAARSTCNFLHNRLKI